jgi:hypothetical protein
MGQSVCSFSNLGAGCHLLKVGYSDSNFVIPQEC